MDDLAKDAAKIHGMPKATHSALRVENMLYLEDVNRRHTDEVIQDLLTDLMHFCDAHRIDYVTTERTARFHYLQLLPWPHSGAHCSHRNNVQTALYTGVR
jgi:hypothetical protein